MTCGPRGVSRGLTAQRCRKPEAGASVEALSQTTKQSNIISPPVVMKLMVSVEDVSLASMTSAWKYSRENTADE